MADSRREVLLKAIETALGQATVDWHSEITTKPTGLAVHRHLTRQATKDTLPDVTIYLLGESPDPLLEAAVDVAERRVRVGVRVRDTAGSGVTGDEALDPLLTWAEIAILNDYTLGGVVAYARQVGLDAVTAREYADTWAEATLQFEFVLQTKWGDPRQAP